MKASATSDFSPPDRSDRRLVALPGGVTSISTPASGCSSSSSAGSGASPSGGGSPPPPRGGPPSSCPGPSGPGAGPARQLVQLALGVRGGVAHLLRGHLGAGHALARPLEPPLKLGLLLGAGLERGGGLLARGGARQREVALGPVAQRGEGARSLLALASDPLGQPLLRTQVAEQLGAAH